MPEEPVLAGDTDINFRDLALNIMAGDKALYDGHAVAAVAATSASAARRALKLIVVGLRAARARDRPPKGHGTGCPHPPSVASDRRHGDTDQRRRQRRIQSRRRRCGLRRCGCRRRTRLYTQRRSTRATSNRTPAWRTSTRRAMRKSGARPRASSWCRSVSRDLCGLDVSKVRVTRFRDRRRLRRQDDDLPRADRAGPVAEVRPPGEDGHDAGGSLSRHRTDIRHQQPGQDRGEEGWNDRRRGWPLPPGGRSLSGRSDRTRGALCLSPYDIANVRAVAVEVVLNRPKVAAYRAPGAPNSEYAVEAVIDELAQRLDLDPIALRLKNAAKEGTRTVCGPNSRGSGMSRPWRRPGRIPITARRSAPSRRAASHPATGRISAAKPARR